MEKRIIKTNGNRALVEYQSGKCRVEETTENPLVIYASGWLHCTNINTPLASYNLDYGPTLAEHGLGNLRGYPVRILQDALTTIAANTDADEIELDTLRTILAKMRG